MIGHVLMVGHSLLFSFLGRAPPPLPDLVRLLSAFGPRGTKADRTV